MNNWQEVAVVQKALATLESLDLSYGRVQETSILAEIEDTKRICRQAMKGWKPRHLYLILKAPLYGNGPKVGGLYFLPNLSKREISVAIKRKHIRRVTVRVPEDMREKDAFNVAEYVLGIGLFNRNR